MRARKRWQRLVRRIRRATKYGRAYPLTALEARREGRKNRGGRSLDAYGLTIIATHRFGDVTLVGRKVNCKRTTPDYRLYLVKDAQWRGT